MKAVVVKPVKLSSKNRPLRTSRYLVLCGVLGLFCSYKTIEKEENRLMITIEGIKKGKGEVIVSIFEEEKNWLKKPFQVIKMNADSDTKTVSFSVEKGKYAVSVFQDENANGELDQSWIGIPKEPIGFGNNYKPFGPPKFGPARVDHNKSESFYTITLYKA
ncbi:Uncharacterized conserved protein, DUF2141 family [Cyclobacterium xiamenense]|uniref:Uncharacterized conserved protein, DUF2141 family n=1 Tax=Cyclobacterium xiamenense TaxID=1297121 RepID=A0A1H6ZX00_9BACT|nr:DUF2141 domain-containing protein [Cyclobacterium xiamenense]SEJ57999.1 Uncharacterized conserved protein, DUF2141 family [Cyclobacterium xiamenense]